MKILQPLLAGGLLLLAACASNPPSGHQADSIVPIVADDYYEAINGNSIIFPKRGHTIHYSEDLKIRLTASGDKKIWQRLFGDEMSGEGIFLADLGDGDRFVGIASSTEAADGVLTMVFLEVPPNADRISDLEIHPVRRMVLGINGFGTDTICRATLWELASTGTDIDWNETPCQIRRGNVLPPDA